MQTTRITLVASVAALSFSSSLFAAPAFAAALYTVRANDTLWLISQREHVSLTSLEAANPGLQANNLQIGAELQLPQPTAAAASTVGSASQHTYTVRQGDTEWLIAKRLGVSWYALQAANPHVTPTNLQPGQTLHVPAANVSSPAASTAGSGAAPTTPSTGGNNNLYWLTRVIAAEAGQQPMDAKIAVGDVIINRTHSPYYANTVQGVIFQTINGHAQFTCVANGWIWKVQPTTRDAAAAQAVLNGDNVAPNAYVFYNPAQTPAGSWVYSQPVVASYGSLTFAK
ncbi:MAG: LysM peptidoglycan-binding domain-containing protein [Bacilli bacterium]